MRGAFFNEIRLRQVKLPCSEIGLAPCEIAFGSLDGEFYFTSANGRYFTMVTPLFHILRSKIFHFTTFTYEHSTKKHFAYARCFLDIKSNNSIK